MSAKKIAKQQRAAQLARTGKVERQLVAGYQEAWGRIKAELLKVTTAIQEAQAAGLSPRRSLILEARRLEGLSRQVEAEIQVVADLGLRAITDAQADALLSGRLHAEELIAASLGPPPPGALAAFQPAFPTGAFRHLVGFAGEGQPLGDLLGKLGPIAAQEVKRQLVGGIVLGRNPLEVARSARNALGGNLNRARTIARTEILRSYREATRETYAANDDVVESWIWMAELDSDTCAVCWAMHGEVFDTEDMLDTHPNCRCAMVPQTKGWGEIDPRLGDIPDTSVELEPGPDVFASRSESLQRQVLGPGAFRAYQSGALKLPDLVQKTHSSVWGKGRRRRSLRSALAKAA